MPQPLSRSGELFNSAVDVYQAMDGGQRDDVAYQRLKNAVNQHLNRFPSDPFALLARGVLEAAVDDISSLETIEDAVSRVPHMLEPRLNFVTALMHFGHLDRALSQVRRAWDQSEGSKSALDRLIRYSLISGHLEDASAWIDQWRRQCPDEPLPPIYLEELETLMLVSENHPECDASVIGDMITVATELARDRGFAPRISTLELHRDEESHWVSVVIGVKADIDSIVDLELEFSERLAHTDLLPRAGSLVSIEFRDRSEVAAGVAA